MADVAKPTQTDLLFDKAKERKPSKASKPARRPREELYSDSEEGSTKVAEPVPRKGGKFARRDGGPAKPAGKAPRKTPYPKGYDWYRRLMLRAKMMDAMAKKRMLEKVGKGQEYALFKLIYEDAHAILFDFQERWSSMAVGVEDYEPALTQRGTTDDTH